MQAKCVEESCSLFTFGWLKLGRELFVFAMTFQNITSLLKLYTTKPDSRILKDKIKYL
jgi:hypothetical protein